MSVFDTVPAPKASDRRIKSDDRNILSVNLKENDKLEYTDTGLEYQYQS